MVTEDEEEGLGASPKKSGLLIKESICGNLLGVIVIHNIFLKPFKQLEEQRENNTVPTLFF
jgi:hypothetical protein